MLQEIARPSLASLNRLVKKQDSNYPMSALSNTVASTLFSPNRNTIPSIEVQGSSQQKVEVT